MAKSARIRAVVEGAADGSASLSPSGITGGALSGDADEDFIDLNATCGLRVRCQTGFVSGDEMEVGGRSLVDRWRVVGGLVWNADDRLLLVANRRRDGRIDWTPPGGVVDSEEDPVSALDRELFEETGLVVDAWDGPCYQLNVDFPDRAMHLEVEVYEAQSFTGNIRLEDPDGIVQEARFVDTDEAKILLESAPLWVRQPVCDYLAKSFDDVEDAHFVFVARGVDSGSLVVERVV